LAGIVFHWKLAQRSTMGRVGSQATSSISTGWIIAAEEGGDTIGSVEAPPDPNFPIVSKVPHPNNTVAFPTSYLAIIWDILGGQSCLSS
jgi:hypothetical protein